MSQRPMDLLAGIKIVSFTHFLIGPASVQYLSDLGADVVKVEPPGSGAWERNWAGGDTFLNGTSACFLLGNRNAKSVTINLKHAEGQTLAKQLAAQADVVVENYRPGTLDRYGLGFDELRKLNPAIIYATSSGYGTDSPYRDLPGQDLLVQALTGLASVTGRQDEAPVPPGAAIVDQHAATLLAMAILAALVHRERTGMGQKIEVTMVQAALDLQLEPIVYHLNGGDVRLPKERLASSFHPAPYGIYETQDGFLAISLSPISRIAEALGNPPDLAEYADPGVALARKDDIRRALGPYLRERSTEDWVSLFRRSGIWCAPVLDYSNMFDSPILQHLDPVLEIDHPDAGPVKLLKHPVTYDGAQPALRSMPPALGQHTSEVMADLGYSPAEIEEFKRAGAI